MDATAAIVCHAFLQKTPASRRQILLEYLTPEEKDQLSELSPSLGDPTKGFPRSEQTLYFIHESWIALFLRSQPESDIRLFLSCLSPSQLQGITAHLLFSNHLPHLSFFATEFVRVTLLSKIAPSTLLPRACLPQNPLNLLLDLELEEWTLLIDLLSMHDLSTEIRHIIDTVKLKCIYEVLTPAQGEYLKKLAYKKEQVVFKKMGLASWNGDHEAFKQTLFQRGINRIAKSLHGSDPSLIWYVSHRLDIERGNALLKLCVPLDHLQATPFLTRQVIESIEIIKNYPHGTSL